MLFVVSLCFKPVDCVIVMDRTCSEGCSRVNCESALASVVLSVSSDRLETIRDDLYCDFVFQTGGLLPCDGPDLFRRVFESQL